MVTHVGDISSGVSQRGNNWTRQQVEVEYIHGQYPCSIIFDVMDSNIVGKVQPGMEVNVKFDVNVREYNGRRYNEFRIWRDGFHLVKQGGDAVSVSTAQPAVAQTVANPAPAASASDNLPF